MPALLIKKLPAPLHAKLRKQAAAHHRSMNGEVIAILERELEPARISELPPPVKVLKPVDHAWIVEQIRDARDGKR